MGDDRRRFALRENGNETSVFKGQYPRQAALKAARKLPPRNTEEEAESHPERIHLRERGTDKVHVYDAWAWVEEASQDGPSWLSDSVTRGNVSKICIKQASDINHSQSSQSSTVPSTTAQPEFTEHVSITRDACHRCGSTKLQATDTQRIKNVTQPELVRYDRRHYTCEDCQENIVATSSDCPSTGGFGRNLLAQAVLFHFEHRIPYKKTATLFEQLYGFSVNPTTILHLCEYMKPPARVEYNSIRAKIRSAPILYADETSHIVNGSTKWLWGFTTGDETLYALRDTRSSDVLTEVLGSDFTGIIVCDGHRAYSSYHDRLQRCWTHLLRGTDDLSDDDAEAWAIYNDLFDIFDGLKEFLTSNPTPVQRLIVAQATRHKLDQLTMADVDSEDANEVLTMLANGLGHWLTFVEFPQVEPTNNRIESLLREPIKIRRIIGQLRNQKGMRLHETYLSLLQTWKQQGENPYQELQRLAQHV